MKTSDSKAMAQRKVLSKPYSNTTPENNISTLATFTYGVPANKRMLSPSLLLKKHSYIRSYLISLRLTVREREAVFHLLRLYSYYGRVYPKAPNFSEDCYISKRSFWRAIAKLQEAGLIDRINRFLNHLQISNSYRLDKLILCIVRYLSEHMTLPFDHFTTVILEQTSFSFWRTIQTLRVRFRDPTPITLEATAR